MPALEVQVGTRGRRDEWREEAACVGHAHLFFPVIIYGDWEKGKPDVVDRWRTADNYRKARIICSTCPVKEPCAAWAISAQNQGIAAGMTARERREIRRKLRLPEPDIVH